jgi:hypothetical protein
LSAIQSIPGVVALDRLGRLAESGAGAAGAAGPLLVLEVPHGATRRAEYEALAARLRSPLPKDLIDFFFVNTDAGAPELARAIAERWVARDPAGRAGALILRSRIPRTFVDCNRRLDLAPEDFQRAGLTPGMGPWISDPADRALLADLHGQYQRVADAACAEAALLLMVHTYAPRTVDVQVDERIVANLHAAYEPARHGTWPLRPEIDLITKAPADLLGELPEDGGLADRVAAAARVAGFSVAISDTYPLHPSTTAWDRVRRAPGRSLCLEVRRDLLADPFEPFAEMRIGATKVARVADALVAGL